MKEMIDFINVWKIGSRWSGLGKKGTCIFDVFKKSNTVFIGKNRNNNNDPKESFRQQVKVGDYICIADGLKIIAVAKVLSKPEPIKKFHHNPKDFSTDFESAFDYKYEYGDNNMMICKADIHNKLGNKEIKDLDFSVTKVKCVRGIFYKMKKYRNEVINLFKKSY